MDPDGSAPAIKVFLLDDHEVVRRGVTDVLESDSGITVIGEAKNAAEAGASGYLLKQILGQDLVTAVRTVAEGGSLLDPTATTAVLERMRRAAQPAGPLAKLSDQERTVLELIGDGLTNRQIGERMFLAEKTVKNYVTSILTKLGLERRTQAAVLASKLLS